MNVPSATREITPAESFRELIDLYTVLSADAQRAIADLNSDFADQYKRRICIRILFTTIEGMVAAMKAHTLNRLTLSPSAVAEIALLAESTFALDDKGFPKARPSFVPLPDNLRFTFRIFAREEGIAYELPVDSDEWRLLRDVVKVRNRLTHPKYPRDLDVSDAEMGQVKQVALWFMTCGKDLMYSLAIRAEVRRQQATQQTDAE